MENFPNTAFTFHKYKIKEKSIMHAYKSKYQLGCIDYSRNPLHVLRLKFHSRLVSLITENITFSMQNSREGGNMYLNMT